MCHPVTIKSNLKVSSFRSFREVLFMFSQKFLFQSLFLARLHSNCIISPPACGTAHRPMEQPTGLWDSPTACGNFFIKTFELS